MSWGACVHFEHIVQINDPDELLAPPLTREQVFNGLRLRVSQPRRFLDAIDEAQVVEDSTGELMRDLRFGTFVIKDRVELQAPDVITTEVIWPPTLAGSSLRMSIEEPAPYTLIVRFVYDSPAASNDPQIGNEHRSALQAAWLHADIDSIRLVRQLAEQGELG